LTVYQELSKKAEVVKIEDIQVLICLQKVYIIVTQEVSQLNFNKEMWPRSCSVIIGYWIQFQDSSYPS